MSGCEGKKNMLVLFCCFWLTLMLSILYKSLKLLSSWSASSAIYAFISLHSWSSLTLSPCEVSDGCHPSSWPFKSSHIGIEVWGTRGHKNGGKEIWQSSHTERKMIIYEVWSVHFTCSQTLNISPQRELRLLKLQNRFFLFLEKKVAAGNQKPCCLFVCTLSDMRYKKKS